MPGGGVDGARITTTVTTGSVTSTEVTPSVPVSDVVKEDDETACATCELSPPEAICTETSNVCPSELTAMISPMPVAPESCSP